MNLLITGGCGFIGSNFINYTKFKYNSLVNLDALYYCASHENVHEHIRTSPNYHFVKGNLCSFDLVSHILSEHNITHVIHFAAQSHVQNSFEESLQYTQDNIVGTHTLLECCHKWGKIEKFIHVSTDEVYGESENLKFDEKTILVPTNPYAATKAAAEMIAMSYIKSYNLPIVITRGNNVYGPNQYPEKLIPKSSWRIRRGLPALIHGDGTYIRSWLHVEDSVDAIMLIINNGEKNTIYNAHGNCELQNIEVVRKIANIFRL
jgi:UDP-glucose 4,6-dehydratase